MRSSPTRRASRSLTALVLQGGGALGAYQGGAFEAMAAAGRQPDWLAGISIGAVNAALIAGNPPERRVQQVREFWRRVTATVPSPEWAGPGGPLRAWANDLAAAWGSAFGLPSFFLPRPCASLWPCEGDAPSLYDTSPLRETLRELVDFDRVNDGPTRLSVGAVDVQSGNFVYFDSREQRLGPEHVMASGALPPGFPAVTIGGRVYWDGGLVSNTPLRHVVEHLGDADATVFQVDLFSARGPVPRTLSQVADREKDIQFSSRTRAISDLLRERHEMRRRLRELVALLPADRRRDPRIADALAGLRAGEREPAITLVHIIHRHKGSETQTRDYEFSRASMREHWEAGRADMARSLRALLMAPSAATPGAFRVLDCTAPDNRHFR